MFHTCQLLKISIGEIARELLRQPRTDQRDLCGRILGIVIAHESMNETTRKTNNWKSVVQNMGTSKGIVVNYDRLGGGETGISRIAT